MQGDDDFRIIRFKGDRERAKKMKTESFLQIINQDISNFLQEKNVSLTVNRIVTFFNRCTDTLSSFFSFSPSFASSLLSFSNK